MLCTVLLSLLQVQNTRGAMNSTVPDAYTQECVQEACRQAMQLLREARQHLRSHPQDAQLTLDRAHESYLSALERVRRQGQNSATLDRLLQLLLETQRELDPAACGDHALALSIAREKLSVYRLHETGDPGLDRVHIHRDTVQQALKQAFQTIAWQDMPETLLQDHLSRLGFRQQTEHWVHPVQLGTVLRGAIRQGRTARKALTRHLHTQTA